MCCRVFPSVCAGLVEQILRLTAPSVARVSLMDQLSGSSPISIPCPRSPQPGWMTFCWEVAIEGKPTTDTERSRQPGRPRSTSRALPRSARRATNATGRPISGNGADPRAGLVASCVSLEAYRRACSPVAPLASQGEAAPVEGLAPIEGTTGR